MYLEEVAVESRAPDLSTDLAHIRFHLLQT